MNRRWLISLALLLLPLPPADAATPSSRVRINQHGYSPAETKWVAVAPASGTPASFEIHRRSDDALVLSGPLVLRRGEERRLRAGHLWVFSNEVDVAKTPLTGFQPGDPVMVVEAGGKPLGTGYVNPSTLIAARLVDRAGRALDRSLVVHRLKVALSLRERLFAEPYYRLVFGESDGLPGLTVERFGDVVVAQATTAGMDRLRDDITEAILKVLAPSVLLWKNDSGARAIEGLADAVELVHGTLDGPAIAREGGVDFLCDLREGQKTGWFYDQRGNRDRLAPYARGAKVLDVFSYLGGWGRRAAAFGARAVDGVDGSARAVAGIGANHGHHPLNVRSLENVQFGNGRTGWCV